MHCSSSWIVMFVYLLFVNVSPCELLTPIAALRGWHFCGTSKMYHILCTDYEKRVLFAFHLYIVITLRAVHLLPLYFKTISKNVCRQLRSLHTFFMYNMFLSIFSLFLNHNKGKNCDYNICNQCNHRSSLPRSDLSSNGRYRIVSKKEN